MCLRFWYSFRIIHPLDCFPGSSTAVVHCSRKSAKGVTLSSHRPTEQNRRTAKQIQEFSTSFPLRFFHQQHISLGWIIINVTGRVDMRLQVKQKFELKSSFVSAHFPHPL